ncbi:hypothetical protein GIB67_024277 [Kingdonia uniflora]|uniref:Uncharacterized protein n=1 Tax=Kingdonia uniflora TaxID=39325 RepID=A0A7J7LZS9_9MAGN|nr:hypothetical protein GIB67_024277 [Kingdonia uniflora]
MLILHKLLKSDILASDPEEREKGKCMLIRDVEDYQLREREKGKRHYDKPLTCFGCSIRWFSFLLGFIFSVIWYYATVLYFGNYNHKDPRERAGLAASAIVIVRNLCSVRLMLLSMLRSLGHIVPTKGGNINIPKQTVNGSTTKLNSDVPELGVTDNNNELLFEREQLQNTVLLQSQTTATQTMTDNTHAIEKVKMLETSTNNITENSPNEVITTVIVATKLKNVDVDSFVSDGELAVAYGNEFERGFHFDIDGTIGKDWTPMKKVRSRKQRMPLSVVTRSKSARQPPN